MNIWWIILLAGAGTYLMRSVGVWRVARRLQVRWLNYVPFAVILVMATHGVADLAGTVQETWAAIAASTVVVVASVSKLPIILCISLGCVVFGTLAGA